MNFVHVKPRNIGRQFDVEKLAEEMRAQGHDVLVVSAKTKPNNQRGRAMTTRELLALLYRLNRCEE